MESLRRQYTSDLTRLAEMRACVREACRRAWSTRSEDDEAIDLLVLALAEAATNIVLHACEGQPGRPIELVVEADETQATVRLYHEGKDFDPCTVPPPSFDGSRVGGFGVYLIRESVDEVQYARGDDGRCVICMVKRRPPPREVGMQPEVESIGDVTIVTVHLDQLDAGNAEDFRRDMAPVLQDARKLVLDLSRVQFVDSRGCGAILSCLKHVSEAGGDLKICHVARPVRMVFELIRLHRICEIVATRDDAVRAFQKNT